ncbi:MAG: hypothetical protein QOI94_3355 [Acidobacteriaceae bacterium]|nr:hypothetical protein [Acidobacteriaceae bacterium]
MINAHAADDGSALDWPGPDPLNQTQGVGAAANDPAAQEWQVRVDLAACYRLVELFGWSDLIGTHISARVLGHEHAFLINSFGMTFDESIPERGLYISGGGSYGSHNQGSNWTT